MFKQFLLGRGLNKLEELLSKTLRHGLTTAGGALVVGGHLTADDLTTLAGAVSIVVGIIASFARTFLSNRI